MSICLDLYVQTIAQTDIKLMPPRNVNHPISFDAKRRLSVQLHTPDWISKTDVPSHALTGDRDKSIFAWMKSGATLALQKFCFIKQSIKFSKNQHYHMSNGKQKPWQCSKEQTCWKTLVLHLCWRSLVMSKFKNNLRKILIFPLN